MQKNNILLNSKNNINENANELYKVICFGVILCLTFILLYNLNLNTHFTSDDFRYHYMYESFLPTANVERIKNLGDIFKSMLNHYNMWGGRITAHILVQLFLIFDKNIFNIINSLAFIGLIIAAYIHSNFSKKINIPLLLGIIFSMWFFIPQFGLTVLWVSGSGNYLWCTLIILLFLIPYRAHFEHNNIVKDNLFSIIIMFICGIFAGWTNENTGGAMILLIFLFMAYSKLNHIKIPKWAFSGFISSCIGFLLLILAPGNNARKAYMSKKSFSIIKNIFTVFGTSYTLMFGITILLILILTLYIIINNNSVLLSKPFILSMMFLVACISGIIVLVASPQIPARTWFGPIIFMIICIGNLYSNLNFKSKLSNIFTIIIIILFTAKFAYSYNYAYKEIHSTNIDINNQISIITKEKENRNLDVIVPSLPKYKSEYNAFNGTRYLSDDKSSWINQWMAKYYGLNSIVGVDYNE